MATEKTPAHKRVARAENSATQWKMKAIERREENEALKDKLKIAQENVKVKNFELDKTEEGYMNLEKQITTLTMQLEQANLTNNQLQAEVDELKKKAR